MTRTPSSTFEVFCRLGGCELPDREELAEAVLQRKLQPGEPLFLTGQSKPFVFVVASGVIKMVYETPQGESWIKGFAQAGLCFASLTALEHQGVTSYSAYAETTTVVEQVDFRLLLQLGARHGAWQAAISEAFKLYGLRKEQREMELLTLSPQDRYLRFIQTHPALAAILRQHDIASYVRVTPVALSRIKSRLKRSGQMA